MTVFLTPDLRPFTGGTYFPPEDKYGRRGFRSILLMLAEAWRDRRADIDAAAGELTEYLQAVAGVQPTPGGLDADLLRAASNALARAFDPSHGGFGQAPKFLHTMDLRLLLRVWKPLTKITPCTWSATRSTAWRWAASTTISAAVSPATAPTPAGSPRTSRRCSTTTPCSSPVMSKPIWLQKSRFIDKSSRRRWPG